MSEAVSVAHVISHTHWDREWYLPFQGFRLKLVDLIDHLLDIMVADPRYRYFHLDGQTIVLEDYLEVRPEREPELRKLIAEGRILIGPWYVSPDEFLPSGEAHIRNLLMGKAVCNRFGADPMPAGHVIDAFGHIAQLPQILAGFGIAHALLFRGVYREQVPAEFTWRGPDGTEALVLHLDDDFAYSNFWYGQRCSTTEEMGAYFGAHRPYRKAPEVLAPDEAFRRFSALVERQRKVSGTRQLLMMDGIDHIEPNPNLGALIDDLRPRSLAELNCDVVHSTIPEYLAALDADLAESPTALPTLAGELRWPNRDGALNAVLAGVMSSRVGLKQANDLCQRLLTRWCEPFSALASLAAPGFAFPHGAVNVAWRHLLHNQPHDSICGCSIDQVHKDMVFRFDQCETLASDLASRALFAVASGTDLKHLEAGQAGAVLFNARQEPTSGVELMQLTLDTGRLSPSFDLFGPGGKLVAHQVLDQAPATMALLSGHDVPCFRAGQRLTLAVDLSEVTVPGLGYTTLELKPRVGVRRETAKISPAPGVLENEWLRVSTNPNGTIDVLDKATGELFGGLLLLEDRGDVGEGWNWIPPALDSTYSSIGCSASVATLCNGPLAATLRICFDMPVPEAAQPGNAARGTTLVPLRVEHLITLSKASKRVEVETRVENTARDHRLRVLFPSAVKTATYVTDTQFHLTERPVELPATPDWRETYPATAPMESLVAVASASRSLAVLSYGQREAEVVDDRDRTVALTLFRGFRNTVGTTGEPGGQCLGGLTFHYAVLPGQGPLQPGQVLAQAEAFALPLRSVVQEHLPDFGLGCGPLALSGQLAALPANAPLRFGTLKGAENRDGFVLRLCNFSQEPTTLSIGVRGDALAEGVRLDESSADSAGSASATTAEPMPAGNACVGGWQIASFRVRPGLASPCDGGEPAVRVR